jgi:hypothetical protein
MEKETVEVIVALEPENLELLPHVISDSSVAFKSRSFVPTFFPATMHRTDNERLYEEIKAWELDEHDEKSLAHVAAFVLREYSVDNLNLTLPASYTFAESMLAADKSLCDAVQEAYKNRRFEDLGRRRKVYLFESSL